jgi:hypothetical protein
MSIRLYLNREPFVSFDPSLSQDYRQELHADHSTVRVWYRNEKVSPDHVRMLSSVIRSLEPQLPQAPDQLSMRDGR